MRKVQNTEAQAKENPMGVLLENAIFGSGAIERQEAAGQAQLVNSDTFPTRAGGYASEQETAEYRRILAKWGFEFLGQVEGDDLFEYVKLPDGWKRQRTDHSMWSEIVDAKGRKRIAIFYKAAFYDRNAFYSLNRRYEARQDYDARDRGEAVAIVEDAGKRIYSTPPTPIDKDKPWIAGDKAYEAAKEWLSKNYPEANKFDAYWE